MNNINQIRLIRFEKIKNSVFGILRAQYEHDLLYTLESELSIIPKGTYALSIYKSIKFKRELPILDKVKDRSFILIHGGNTIRDTQGCILLGKFLELDKERISSCYQAVDELTRRVKLNLVTSIKIDELY